MLLDFDSIFFVGKLITARLKRQELEFDSANPTFSSENLNHKLVQYDLQTFLTHKIHFLWHSTSFKHCFWDNTKILSLLSYLELERNSQLLFVLAPGRDSIQGINTIQEYSMQRMRKITKIYIELTIKVMR